MQEEALNIFQPPKCKHSPDSLVESKHIPDGYTEEKEHLLICLECELEKNPE